MKKNKIITEESYKSGDLIKIDGINKKVINRQYIFMTYSHGYQLEISLNDEYLYYNEMEKIAFETGFNSHNDFVDYFYDKIMNDENGEEKHFADQLYKGYLIEYENI